MTVGIPPNDPNKYLGSQYSLLSVVSRPRRPISGSAGVDVRQPETGKLYPVGSLWQVAKDPTTGSEGEIWVLSRITANTPYWVLISTGIATDGIMTLTGDNATAVGPNGAGNVDIQGTVIGTGINAKPVSFLGTEADPVHLQNLQIQVSKARTGAPGDKNDVGLCSFDDTDFAVDGNGYVTLIGSNFSWVVDATQTIQTEVNTGYITTNALTVTATLPATASPGQMVCFEQYGAGEIVVAQNAGQTIHTVTGDTTTGVAGTLSTIDQYSSFCLICVVADTDWMLQRGSHGSLLIA